MSCGDFQPEPEQPRPAPIVLSLQRLPYGKDRFGKDWEGNAMQVNAYLMFDGKCDEALQFYQAKVGAKVTAMMRFKDAPPEAQVSPDSREKVMHSEIQIGETKVMASDGYCKGAPKFDGFSLVIQCKDDTEAAQRYKALSDGGQETMPLAKTFFASSFGILTDKFGVSWMIIAG
jgi:PhnB protein